MPDPLLQNESKLMLAMNRAMPIAVSRWKTKATSSRTSLCALNHGPHAKSHTPHLWAPMHLREL